jgi:S1-C subfamily serine protease
MLTAHVVVGGLLVAYLSFSVAADVARYHRVLTAMAKANVPESWLTTLAALKAAGALGLLVGIGVPLIGTSTAAISTTAAAIGTAAAVGVISFFVGALITHLRARDPSLAPATVFPPARRDHAGVGAGYLASYHVEPADRGSNTRSKGLGG